MCFLLAITFVIAAVTFFSKGLLIQAVISGVIATIFLFFFTDVRHFTFIARKASGTNVPTTP
ncbi:hypothetical protein [Sulfuricurvum sp.]|uniref:hypothetical protein n=1 Tax=Sulfuricurvum sp. TaxID=2025608 RepID=UPI00198A57BA|nr:hypothetical protein [Sulfuricurvum sp.]MBD3806337.1 hypothetical protein [Sulfuricurvum sp.]